MRPSLLPLDQQVVVITGASSGIGLVTAKAAALLRLPDSYGTWSFRSRPKAAETSRSL